MRSLSKYCFSVLLGYLITFTYGHFQHDALLPDYPLYDYPDPSVIPEHWTLNNIAALIDQLNPYTFQLQPPHIIHKINRYCRIFYYQPRCGFVRWRQWAPVYAQENNMPITLATTTTIPPVPRIAIPDFLAGVPAGLSNQLSAPFARLSDVDKNALLSVCSGTMDCKKQSDASVRKRAMVENNEVTVARAADPNGRIPLMKVKLRLIRTQQVKEAILKTAGISDYVVAANDGTFQNDILLSEPQSDWLLNVIDSGKNRRKKRESIFLDKAPVEKWNIRSPIKYGFHQSLSSNEREIIMNSLKMISDKTCINFEYTNAFLNSSFIYYIKLFDTANCGLSYIGRVEPVNPIYISFLCKETSGIVVHETMHALGINHEQLRGDRDNYVTIMWKNINPTLYDYFAIGDSKQFTSYGVVYDYHSIMHYNPYIGSTDPSKPSIVPKIQPERNLKIIGQRKNLSDRDMELLTAMYCNEGCIDMNVYCGAWSLKLLCNKPEHESWMKTNCRKSCGYC